METTKDLLQSYGAKFKDADDITLQGYVQMPRVILYARSLKDADKITHLLLLSFAWQQPHCFPSQETLAKMRGKTARQTRRNLSKLSELGFINIINHGSMRPNTYEILCRVAKGGEVVLPAKCEGNADITYADADDFSLGGFVKVPNALLEDADLGDGAILTYAVISDQGNRCPTQEVMAKDRGIRRQAFSSHVSELVRRGYMEVRKDNWSVPQEYILRFRFKKPPKREAA